MLVLVPLSTVIINPINPVSKLFYWVPYTYIYTYTRSTHTPKKPPLQDVVSSDLESVVLRDELLPET